MFKIGIVPNLTRKTAPEVTLRVAHELNKLNIAFLFSDDIKEYISKHLPGSDFTDDIYTEADIIIAIGGDGSFIHVAKQAAIHSKPVLCINAGNLAFLAGLEVNELSLLKKLISGDYTVDRRMMLDASIVNNGKKVFLGSFLNDIVVARGAEIKLIELNIMCDGRTINSYRSDGVIVSTPTGSTAYSWSAGGPVIDPALECTLLTPICTHSPLNRSLVFSNHSKIEIISSNNSDISVSVDGEKTVNICGGNSIIIEKADHYAEFIRIKSDEFFDILNSKLTLTNKEK